MPHVTAGETAQESGHNMGRATLRCRNRLCGDHERRHGASAFFQGARARLAEQFKLKIDTQKLVTITSDLAAGETSVSTIIPQIKRELQTITRTTKSNAFVILDDFHLIDWTEQPKFLHLLHGALKGANGWIKVAGLRSLLNYYSAGTSEGLQVPGDAQIISLDLTLENPEAAESHLRAILGSFLRAVGYTASGGVLPDQAFRRLAWATAGVPRDFLQMFARAVEHARRNIRELDRRARHARRVSNRRRAVLEGFEKVIERAHNLTQRIGGNARVESRSVKLGMAEQTIVTLITYLRH